MNLRQILSLGRESEKIISFEKIQLKIVCIAVQTIKRKRSNYIYNCKLYRNKLNLKCLMTERVVLWIKQKITNFMMTGIGEQYLFMNISSLLLLVKKINNFKQK